ncbi:phosphate permease [Panaeolus papilionaceus]|nr:phosphate permease [Panaeolus papilionaceus]
MSSSLSHERRTSDVVIFTKKLDESRELASKRRAALAEIDNAKFSWFHARVCIVAGIGFFTDAYDIFAINVAAVMLGYVYGHDKKLAYADDLGLKIATPVGTLVGQILFGWLADMWGRKKMYGIELMIMIVSTFAQAISAEGQAVRIVPVLIVWRFIMGVGVGGDYPLSAIMASEFASKKIRGRMMVSIFACQGWGNIAAVLVAFTLTNAYKNSIQLSTDDTFPNPFDPMWRLLIGIGCIPAAVALYFRLTIPETPRFTMDIECNIQQATQDINSAVGSSGQSSKSSVGDVYATTVERIHLPKATWKDFRNYFGKAENFKVLFGTAYSWFALDVVFYGLNLNSAYLLTAIGFSSGGNPNDSAQYKRFANLNDVCIGNLILAAGGLIPGYWASFFFIDSWGRKSIQLMGFTVLTVLFIVMGAAYPFLIPSNPNSRSPGFVFLYCLTNFFTNFGPNVSTFIIPGEVFPTRYRSTAHGFSAGMGKLGAILGQLVISELRKDHPEEDDLAKVVRYVFMIFAIFMVTGIFSTWFLLPETKKKTLEELSNENQDTFVLSTLFLL